MAVPIPASAIPRPKPEDTTRADQAKFTMAKRSLRVNDEASRNTKLVETGSRSKNQAGQWPKRVKRKAKASGKIRREQVQKWVKANRPRPAKRQTKSKTSEVQRRGLPKDSFVNKDQHHSSEVYRTTSPINTSFESKLSTEQRTSNWAMTLSKNASYRQAKSPGGQSTDTHTQQSTEKSTESWPVKSYRQAKSSPESVYWEVDQQSSTSRPRFYWGCQSRAQPEVDHEVYQEVDHHSTEDVYQEQLWSRPDGQWSGLPKTNN